MWENYIGKCGKLDEKSGKLGDFGKLGRGEVGGCRWSTRRRQLGCKQLCSALRKRPREPRRSCHVTAIK